MYPRLAITPGEPAGIGPELVVALTRTARDCGWVAVADAGLLERTARRLDVRLNLDERIEAPSREAHALTVLHVPMRTPEVPGRLDVRNAEYVVRTLEVAADGCTAGSFDALVTGPVQKSVINDSGMPFTGHTEFLRDRAEVEDVVMMLTAGDLRVALATTHVPLKDVALSITRPLLRRRLGILLEGLESRYGLARPRVLVAGLNPHAGEGGHLGREEIDVITPVLEAFRAKGATLEGPLPADTLFTPALLDTADAVFAMYHDQGLPVLKHVGFGRAVNVTLGLPYVRTSVDHGTALDLAGTGRADPGSLLAALAEAERMSRAR